MAIEFDYWPRGQKHFTIASAFHTLKQSLVFIENSMTAFPVAIDKYRKIPVISPGLIQLRKGFWVDL